MKYYPVYDSNNNDLLGMLSCETEIHDKAESIDVPIMTKGAIVEGTKEAQEMWDAAIETVYNVPCDECTSKSDVEIINFEIRKIFPPPKLDSFFPPRYLIIDLNKYDRDVEKLLRHFLKVFTPNQN